MPQSLRLCFLHPCVIIVISSSVTFLVPKKYPYALSSPKLDKLLWDLSSDILFEGQMETGPGKVSPAGTRPYYSLFTRDVRRALTSSEQQSFSAVLPDNAFASKEGTLSDFLKYNK